MLQGDEPPAGAADSDEDDRDFTIPWVDMLSAEEMRTAVGARERRSRRR